MVRSVSSRPDIVLILNHHILFCVSPQRSIHFGLCQIRLMLLYNSFIMPLIFNFRWTGSVSNFRNLAMEISKIQKNYKMCYFTFCVQPFYILYRDFLSHSSFLFFLVFIFIFFISWPSQKKIKIFQSFGSIQISVSAENGF